MSNFNAALGVGRGSALAQAQRDNSELSHALGEFRSTVNELFLENILVCTTKVNPPPHKELLLYDVLADIYVREHAFGATPTTADTAELLQTLMRGRKQRAIDACELLTLTVLGDPEGCLGFSAPAVEALARFFKQPSRSPLLIDIAGLTTTSCFAEAFGVENRCVDKPEDARCLRLQPLLEALAALMSRRARQGKRWGNPVWATLPVSTVSTATLLGPMRSWVKAVAAYIPIIVDPYEHSTTRAVLETVIKERGHERGFKEAFAPIITALNRKPRP